MVQVIKFPPPNDAIWASWARELVKNVDPQVDRELLDDAIEWARTKWQGLPETEAVEFTLYVTASPSAMESQVQDIVAKYWEHNIGPIASYLAEVLVDARLETLIALRDPGDYPA